MYKHAMEPQRVITTIKSSSSPALLRPVKTPTQDSTNEDDKALKSHSHSHSPLPFPYTRNNSTRIRQTVSQPALNSNSSQILFVNNTTTTTHSQPHSIRIHDPRHSFHNLLSTKPNAAGNYTNNNKSKTPTPTSFAVSPSSPILKKKKEQNTLSERGTRVFDSVEDLFIHYQEVYNNSNSKPPSLLAREKVKKATNSKNRNQSQLTFHPQIDPNSKEIVRRKSPMKEDVSANEAAQRRAVELYEHEKVLTKKKEIKKAELEQKEMKECTFTPKLSSKQVGNITPGALKRMEAWDQQRQEKIQKKREETQAFEEIDEMQECTFQPNASLSPRKTQPPTTGSSSPVSNVNGYVEYLQRQQLAKGAKEEQVERERRAFASGLNYSGVPTQPQEFTFMIREKLKEIVAQADNTSPHQTYTRPTQPSHSAQNNAVNNKPVALLNTVPSRTPHINPSFAFRPISLDDLDRISNLFPQYNNKAHSNSARNITNTNNTNNNSNNNQVNESLSDAQIPRSLSAFSGRHKQTDTNIPSRPLSHINMANNNRNTYHDNFEHDLHTQNLTPQNLYHTTQYSPSLLPHPTDFYKDNINTKSFTHQQPQQHQQPQPRSSPYIPRIREVYAPPPTEKNEIPWKLSDRNLPNQFTSPPPSPGNNNNNNNNRGLFSHNVTSRPLFVGNQHQVRLTSPPL